MFALLSLFFCAIITYMSKKIFDWKVNISDLELREIVEALRGGKLVVFPTETVYGIGADAFNGNACKRIFVAKGRPSDNPLIVHVSDFDMLEKCVQNVSDIERKLIDKFMPGPFTLILEKKRCIPPEVTAGLDTVAVRMPNNMIANRIISEFGRPIAAPSANVSGKPSGTRLEDIKNELGNNVFALIDGGSAEIGLESTVVRVVNDVPVILRPGWVTAEEIEAVAGTVRVDEHVLHDVRCDEMVLSPGMKHRHYAPKTRCVLVDIEDFMERISVLNLFVNSNVCVLGIGKRPDELAISSYFSMGESADEISRNIFALLRKVDLLGCDLILIQSVKSEGLGLAIMNRLIRTCEYNVIKSKAEVVDSGGKVRWDF